MVCLNDLLLLFFVIVFRKKIEMSISNHTPHHMPTVAKPLNTSKKKKSAPKVTKSNNTPIVSYSLHLVEIVILYAFHFFRYNQPIM